MGRLVDKLKSIINENESKVHLLTNEFINDDDIIDLLKVKIPSDMSVYIISCTVEIKTLKNKQIEKFTITFKPKNCEIYFNKAARLSTKIIDNLKVGNTIIKSTVLEHLIFSFDEPLKYLSEDKISNIQLKDLDLSKIILPINRKFFQLIKNKKVEKVKLPDIDFTKYDISGVEFLDCKFSENTIISDDFFQKIKYKKIIGCKLPPINFNEKNIEGCALLFVHFHKRTIFPDDKNFFKGFKLIYGSKFPEYDYLNYDFSNTVIRYCSFPENSILPYSQNLTDKLIENQYPKSYIKSIHIMPINNLDYDELMLKYGKYLTPIQKTIISFKLKNSQPGPKELW